MCRLAGELCDGFHVHPLNSVKYLKEVVRPTIEVGAAKVNRDIEEIKLSASAFIVSGATEKETDQMREMVRQTRLPNCPAKPPFASCPDNDFGLVGAKIAAGIHEIGGLGSDPRAVARTLATLEAAGVAVTGTVSSPLRITVFCADAAVDAAIIALHAEFCE